MRTVNITKYSKNGEEIRVFTRKQLQEIFKVNNRQWWVKRLESCGFTYQWFKKKLNLTDGNFSPNKVARIPLFQLPEIRKLALLDLFLSLKKGRTGFSIEQFRMLNENDYLDELEAELNLNPIQHFQELYHEYNSK